MGTTGIGEGHEKTGTGATWQTDGLRDTDVLSTASLTGFAERGLYNGIIPLTLTNYGNDSGGSDRNNPISGNCAVRKNGAASNSIFVDTGVACLDGIYYNVGNVAAFDIDNVAFYNARFNAGGMVLPSVVNEECWVLVIVDPELPGTNNVGLVGGTVVDTSTGIYPQMPSSHLIKQSCILGAVRVSYATPLLNVVSVEDKRLFIRGGPIPLTALEGSGGAIDPQNDYGTIPALTPGGLPMATLGMVYARDPAGYNPLNAHIHGAGETHLFYQADQAIGAGNGGAYQITPVHRQAKEVVGYVGLGPAAAPLQFTPLSVENTAGAATLHIVSGVWADITGKTVPLIEGVHYTIMGKIVTFMDLALTVPVPQGPLGAGDVWFYYTHAGY